MGGLSAPAVQGWNAYKDLFSKPIPCKIDGTDICFDERYVEPIWSFMYAGGDIGGSFGLVNTDPNTGTRIGISASMFSSGGAALMLNTGGLSVGAIYDGSGSFMPAIGYGGVYFYGNGVSFGMFSFGVDGFTVAPFYVPIILGFLNTLPFIIQNAESLGEMENPGIVVLLRLLKNIIYAAIPVGLFEKIIDNKADISDIPPLNTKQGAMAAMALLGKLREENKIDKGKDAALLLYRAAKDASPFLRAEIMNQYDLFLRAGNSGDIPGEGLKENLKWALSKMEGFQSEYREWLTDGAGKEPSRKEIDDYMTASLLASQKLPLLARKSSSGCLKIVASAAVDFEGSERDYLRIMTDFSDLMADKSSGLWKFISNEQKNGAIKLNGLIKNNASTEEIVDAKFQLDSSSMWASSVIALVSDGENRFNYLKWKIKDTSDTYDLASGGKMGAAYNARDTSEEYAEYIKIKPALDSLENVFAQSKTKGFENSSAIFAMVYGLEQMGSEFTVTGEVEAYTDIKKRAYEMLEKRTHNELGLNRRHDFAKRYLPKYKDATEKLGKISKKFPKDDPSFPEINSKIEALTEIFDRNRNNLFIEVNEFDIKHLTKYQSFGGRRKLLRDSGILTKDINYDCQTFTESLIKNEEEVFEVIRHCERLAELINDSELSDGEKADLIKIINGYLRKYRLFVEKRNAIIEAEALKDQGGKVCQP